MMKEGQQPPEQIDIKPLLLLGGIFLLSQFAFSLDVKKLIWKRDEGKSRLSGATENLEVAHVDHSKSNPRYNDQSNGRLLTKKEHLQEHINRAGRNGLTKNQNDFAIRELTKRSEDD